MRLLLLLLYFPSNRESLKLLKLCLYFRDRIGSLSKSCTFAEYNIWCHAIDEVSKASICSARGFINSCKKWQQFNNTGRHSKVLPGDKYKYWIELLCSTKWIRTEKNIYDTTPWARLFKETCRHKIYLWNNYFLICFHVSFQISFKIIVNTINSLFELDFTCVLY